MLDAFEIISTSGVVLWSKSYVPVGAGLISSLIRDVFVEENASAQADPAAVLKPTYRRDGYTLKWTTAKDLGLIFVAVYQSLLHISWIDKLLENVRAIFSELYRDRLKTPTKIVQDYPFDPYFDRQIQELEKLNVDKGNAPEPDRAQIAGSELGNGESAVPELRLPPKKAVYDNNTSTDASPIPTPDTSRPSSPAVNINHLVTGKGGPKGSRRARKAAAAATSAPVSSGDESPARLKQASLRGKKQMRKWDADGNADDGDDRVLDYSAPSLEVDRSDPANVEAVSSESWGARNKQGQFVLKDIGEEMDAILQKADAKTAGGEESSGLVASSFGAIGGLFRNVVGGKTLTKEDLAKPMKAMEDQLLKKNVAREAAVRLCDSVERELVGMKTHSFTSIEATMRQAMEKALRKILTPTSPLDLLLEIQAVQGRRPYVISIVGVNGVGKSTNLSKIAYFLLQNHYKVLITAGDTFRSGAVEQLRVHVRNLQELTKRQDAGQVELFERGYAKDPAVVARDAVSFARTAGFDVVLIDTAGRRHNDKRLMSSLENFAKLAQPDKILMVGEALVGTDSVAQARNFDTAFGPGRRLDGFIVSKCDTVGDMVGTMVSLIHATGIPVLFVGTGQHYSDIRAIKVETFVQLLMR